jgi:hypothetical protein
MSSELFRNVPCTNVTGVTSVKDDLKGKTVTNLQVIYHFIKFTLLLRMSLNLDKGLEADVCRFLCQTNFLLR